MKEAEKSILSATAFISATQTVDELRRNDGDSSTDVEEVSPKQTQFKSLAIKLSSSHQSKQPKASSAQLEVRRKKDELLSQQIPDFQLGLEFWLAHVTETCDFEASGP